MQHQCLASVVGKKGCGSSACLLSAAFFSEHPPQQAASPSERTALGVLWLPGGVGQLSSEAVAGVAAGGSWAASGLAGKKKEERSSEKLLLSLAKEFVKAGALVVLW